MNFASLRCSLPLFWKNETAKQLAACLVVFGGRVSLHSAVSAGEMSASNRGFSRITGFDFVEIEKGN